MPDVTLDRARVTVPMLSPIGAPLPGVLGCATLFRRLWEKLKTIWKLAKSERASPREIGWAVAIGAFAGCTPAVGVHGPLAIGLATLFKKNRLFAWLGSRVSNIFFLPFITIAEVQVSHRIRTGEWVTLDREQVMEQAGSLLLDWCLGTIPVGAAISTVLGVASWALAVRRDRRRAAKEAESSAAEPPAIATLDSPAALGAEDDAAAPESARSA